MIVKVTETIARPPAEVFRVVSDVRNDPQWHTDVLEARLTNNGEVAQGSVFDVQLKPSMGVSGGTITIVELDPPHRVVMRGHIGKMEPTLTHVVEPVPEGTLFTRQVDLALPFPMAVMTPLVRQMILKANRGFVANLKRGLEAG
jgi:uncharacterized protein YndB with AHSA1/START domain